MEATTAAIRAVIVAVLNMAAIKGIRRTLAEAGAILAPSAVAPMRTKRASASNAALPCRPVNVPAAARNSQQAPSFAASAANPSSNVHLEHHP